MRLLGMFSRKTPPSLLRELVDEAAFRKGPLEAKAELRRVALLVRRAGLEHLVQDATPIEVAALAEAGEELAKERAALLAASLQDPPRAFAPFDEGKALRTRVLDEALALSKRGG